MRTRHLEPGLLVNLCLLKHCCHASEGGGRLKTYSLLNGDDHRACGGRLFAQLRGDLRSLFARAEASHVHPVPLAATRYLDGGRARVEARCTQRGDAFVRLRLDAERSHLNGELSARVVRRSYDAR